MREYFANGLKVGPNYCRPGAPVANQWRDEGNPNLSTEPPEDAAWWQAFHDPVLDRLIASAYQQNLTLRVAGLRILEARAQRAIATGELFPQQQDAFGNYTRNALSLNGPAGAAIDRFFSEWKLGATLAWELDFWGRFRRAIESADANLDASVENYDDVLVILVSDVAQSYTDVRVAEQRLAYARQNLEIQGVTLRDVRKAKEQGLASGLDVSQIEGNFRDTEASIPPLESARRQAVNRLCILLGMPPQDLDQMLAASGGIPKAPAQVAVGIPAELLRRRPDIRRAEREVAAQAALIGVAESDLYPHFSIDGSIYLNAKQFEDLFDADSFAGSVGPSFRWDILNYGRLTNNVCVQESRFQQLAVQYQNVVLQANAEAENAIVSFLNAQQQVQSLAASADAAQTAEGLMEQVARQRHYDYNRVFVLQQFLSRQQDSLAVAQGSVAQSLIQLYKALGGGWQIRLNPPPAGPPAAPTEPAQRLPEPAVETPAARLLPPIEQP